VIPGSARKSRFESTTSAHAFVETSASSEQPATTPKKRNVGRSMSAPSAVTTGGAEREKMRDRKSRALEGAVLVGAPIGSALDGEALDGEALGGEALGGEALGGAVAPASRDAS
jgi:hypothetical protein